MSVLERGRHGRLLARETFSLPEGADAAGVTATLTRAGRQVLRAGETVRAIVSVRTRGARGEPVLTPVRLHQ